MENCHAEKLVSIIVPAYNVEDYLEKCLESCVNQTLEEIEVICVDDASPDGCAAIIDRFACMYPEKVIPVHLKKNMRQGGARNVAMRLANGKYLCFVDGDDYIDTNMCKELYDIAVKNNRDIVCCDSYQVKDGDYRYFEKINKIDLDTLSCLNCFTSQCFMIIRKEIIIENQLFYPEEIYHEDTAVVPLWYIKAASRELVKRPYYFNVYRRLSTSRSADFTNQLQLIEVLRILIENAKRVNVYEQFRRQLDVFIFIRILSFVRARWKEPDLNEENKLLLHQELENWKGYCFDRTLYPLFFTKSEIEAVDALIQMERIVSPYKRDGNYYEDVSGNIEALCQYITDKLKRTIVIWGYGIYGRKVVNTLRNLSKEYVVGDNNKKIQNKYTDSGDIIHDKDWIDNNIDRPFFFIASRIYYRDICCDLGINPTNSINIWEYIEKGLDIDFIKNIV